MMAFIKLQLTSYYSFYQLRKDERLSRPTWLTYSGWFTHISGYTRQLLVERRTAKVRRSKTNVLALHHATITNCVLGATQACMTLERQTVYAMHAIWRANEGRTRDCVRGMRFK